MVYKEGGLYIKDSDCTLSSLIGHPPVRQSVAISYYIDGLDFEEFLTVPLV